MEEQCMWQILIPFFTVFLIGQIWKSASFKLMGLTEFRVIFAIHFFLIQQYPVLKFCIRMSPLGHDEARPILNISINSYNNHAQIAGSAVLGGLIDNCAIDLEYNTTSIKGIEKCSNHNWNNTISLSSCHHGKFEQFTWIHIHLFIWFWDAAV